MSDPEIEMASPPRKRRNLGILSDKQTDEVPGSVLLLSGPEKINEPLGMKNFPARISSSSFPSQFSRTNSLSSTTHRPTFSRRSTARAAKKKKTTPDGKIVLEPQPEDTHNDPLNLPPYRRNLALLSLGFYCMLGGGMTPVLAAGFGNVATTFDISIQRVALTTGLYMMGLGVGGALMSPTAILLGKRPVYLISSLLFIATSLWCGFAKSFGSLVAARVLQGVAVSPVEVLPSATVAEIFFLHERAFRLGVYTLLLLSGKNLVPLVSAVIINKAGWRWAFWAVAIFVAFGAILLFLFLPETFWDRTPRPHGMEDSTDNIRPTLRRLTSHFRSQNHSGANEISESQDLPPKAIEDETEKEEPVEPEGEERLESKPEPKEERTSHQDESRDGANHVRFEYTEHWRDAPKKKFVHTLKPYFGRLSYDNWITVAVRPFILFAYPSVLWSAMVYSLSIGWLIVISEAITSIYRSKDTYNFTSFQAGLVYLSPFIGGVLGTAVAGKFSDIIVRAMARRNGGVYEPEFRLVMALPIAISTTVGLMGFGWAAEERDAWIVPTVFFGIVSFGCSLGSTTAITFCVDSYRQYAGEALVTLNFSKNIFHGLVFSLFFPQWFEAKGSKSVFLALGGIQLGLMFFSIPMYIYGKRARMWTVRKNFIERFSIGRT
ncbi:MFS general substrate transporter [Microthyrium microscopicum]|uniref:MFS general substrate transporter n=1 Tax=Microthyrium microscopicum TaxID=703497 RepID=A0A6A6UUR8_9PEZI|nr:MFS general substrate transporter [Microthyrium microscopicum]